MKRLAIGILSIVLLLTIALAYITDFESLEAVASRVRLERIIDSPNYDGKRFVNTEPTSRLKDGTTWSLEIKFVSSNIAILAETPTSGYSSEPV